MSDSNIWSDDWGEQGEDWSGGGALAKRLVPSGPLLGASLYEGGPVSDTEGEAAGLELLLPNPTAGPVVWLDERRRPEPDEAEDDDEPPHAA